MAARPMKCLIEFIIIVIIIGCNKFEMDASMIVLNESGPKANGTSDRLLFWLASLILNIIHGRRERWCWIQINAMFAKLFVAKFLVPL